MPRVEFESLYLLSQTERRALRVPLNSQKLIIQGGNGFGKSAIIKSLYEAMGTTPRKIDDRWKKANVSSLLHFKYLDRRYTVVKALGVYSLFDSHRRLLFSGQRLVKDWGPLLADFFHFKLEMADKDGETIVPPPAYMVAPYYVDQDGGWAKEWTSFDDYYLNDTPRTLSEFHSGIKPNEYYTAKAKHKRQQGELNQLQSGTQALRETIAQVQQVQDVQGPTLDLEEFKDEIDDLVARSEELLAAQSRHRATISDLHEEAHLLSAEKTLLIQTLTEMRSEFEFAAGLPSEVPCPTCGQEYYNSLADRFALIADEGVLQDALGKTSVKLGKIVEKENKERANLGDIEDTLRRIERALNVQRSAMKLNDFIVAAGKTEAAKILRSSLNQKILEVDTAQGLVDELKADMDTYANAERTSEVLTFFRKRLSFNCQMLDVQLDGPDRQPINTIRVARGSEGPRALLAYYYAFLETKVQFTSDVRFPLVIDAPNQQGQDAVHLPQMLKFIFEQAPENFQVIVATEDAGKTVPTGVQVSTYGERKRQVLRDNEYDEVRAVFEPYFQAILSASDGN